MRVIVSRSGDGWLVSIEHAGLQIGSIMAETIDRAVDIASQLKQAPVIVTPSTRRGVHGKVIRE